jgi:hypothetical protein
MCSYIDTHTCTVACTSAAPDITCAHTYPLLTITQIYHEHLLHYDEADPDDISAEAKEEALKEWASTYGPSKPERGHPLHRHKPYLHCYMHC